MRLPEPPEQQPPLAPRLARQAGLVLLRLRGGRRRAAAGGVRRVRYGHQRPVRPHAGEPPAGARFPGRQAELPPLARYGLSPERLRETEAARELDVRVQEALTTLASFYHRRLKDAPEVLEWLRANYGIAEQTIDTLRIGYAANGPCEEDDGRPQAGVLSALTTGENTFTPRKLAATGAFRPTGQDGLIPFFEGRIVFPYWSHGRVVFLIGRKTPWTPDRDWEQGKYRKLPVHNDHSNGHIAPSINNGHLYNEDCLLTRPERVR